MKRKKSVPYEPDLHKRLRNPKYAAGYLMACLKPEKGDPKDLFLLALSDVAKAYGMSNIARKTKLSRESLYRIISKKGNPTLVTLYEILDAVGLKLSIEAKKAA